MSALGHEQTSRYLRVMSVIPLKADIHQHGLHVRLVPLADIVRERSTGGSPSGLGDARTRYRDCAIGRGTPGAPRGHSKAVRSQFPVVAAAS
jgi:hypothetical protein